MEVGPQCGHRLRDRALQAGPSRDPPFLCFVLSCLSFLQTATLKASQILCWVQYYDCEVP